MARRDDETAMGVAHALADDDVQGVLSGSFYVPPGGAAERKPAKPDHYKVICISMYTRDLARLDAYVRRLKKRGVTTASRSALIRLALERLDVKRTPRGL